MRVPLFALRPLFIVGCDGGSPEDTGRPPIDTDADTDTDPPPCVQDGVDATATIWSLPAGFPTYTFDDVSDDSPSAPNWSLLELDGDGLPDLVVESWASSGIAGLGTSQWLWYANDRAGFSATASSWSLPADFPTDTFDHDYDDSSADPDWSLLDLNGDGLVDIVVPSWDESSISGLGTTKWLWYENSGSAFAATAASWALPAVYPTDTFDDVSDDSSAAPVWVLTDLDGDGLTDLTGDAGPDLALTYYDGSGIDRLGTSAWLVYMNDTASAFAASPSSWALPSDMPSRTFDELADDSSSAPDWYLLNLDGENTSEIVITWYEGSGITELGDTEWFIYTATCD